MALGIKSFKSGFERGKSSSFNKGMTNIGRLATSRGTGRLINQKLISQSKRAGGFKKGFKKFMGASNKAKGRFLRVKGKKFLGDTKKFFKKSRKKEKQHNKKKRSLMMRKRAESALEGGRKSLASIKNSVMKSGFNPVKFVMMIFAGWIINNLPKLIEGIKKFIEKNKPLLEGLGKFFKGVWEFMKWIGGGLLNLWNSITGNSDKLSEEEQKLKSATNDLKSEFKKHEKGHKELIAQAQGEQAKLVKDFDQFNDEVNQELIEQGLEPEVKSNNDKNSTQVVNSSVSNNSHSVQPNNKIIPSTFSNNRTNTLIGTGRPITVEIKGKTVVLQPGTTEYNNFFIAGGIKDQMIAGTNDFNLVQTPTGPKIISVEIPINSSANSQEQLIASSMSSNGASSSSVNSRNVLLHSIER